MAKTRKKIQKREIIQYLLRVMAIILFIGPVLVILPLRWIDPGLTMFMIIDRMEGDVRVKDLKWTSYPKVSDNMKLAVMAAEDQRFPDHWGFDLQSIYQAADQKRGRPKGASTITQQTVKNLFLWKGRSWFRKILEAYLTVYSEILLPKKRILEIYLNIIEFGPGIYGVGNAAQDFFKTNPAGLSAWQAARLVSVMPNPIRFKVNEPSEYIKKRTRDILDLMTGFKKTNPLARL